MTRANNWIETRLADLQFKRAAHSLSTITTAFRISAALSLSMTGKSAVAVRSSAACTQIELSSRAKTSSGAREKLSLARAQCGGVIEEPLFGGRDFLMLGNRPLRSRSN